MERAVDTDLSDVRLHTGPRAGAAARRLRAEAFTVGRDIAFAPGRFRPNTAAGRGLLAHELTHAAQQQATGQSQAQRQPTPDLEDDGASDAGTGGSSRWLVVNPSLEPRLRFGTLELPDPRRVASTNLVDPHQVTTLLSPFGPTLIAARTRDGVSAALAGDLLLGSKTPAAGVPLDRGHPPEDADVRATWARTPFVSVSPSGIDTAFVLSLPSDQPRYADPLDLAITAHAGDPNLRATQRGLELGSPIFADVAIPSVASAQIDASLFVRRDRIDRALLPLGLGDAARAALVDRMLAFAVDASARITTALQARSLSPLALAMLVEDIRGRIPDDIRTAAPDASPQAVAAAALAVAREIAAPGFDLVGSARVLGIPGTFHFTAPTTRPRAQPLEGAPTPFPSSFLGVGITVVRPGAVATTAAPAFGITSFSFGERAGGSLTTAGVPTLDAKGIPELRTYAEIAGSVAIGHGFTLGATAAANVDVSRDLFQGHLGGLPAPATMGDFLRDISARRAAAQGAQAEAAATSLFTIDPTLETGMIDAGIGRAPVQLQFLLSLTKRF